MLHPSIEMRQKGAIQGNGLFAVQLIPKGTLVWELNEPTYTWQEIESWSEDRLKPFKRYGFQCGVDRYSSPEGISRELNHSCSPNIWWASSDSMIARYDIFAGDELTYDYSSCDVDLEFEMDCSCGSPCCRGVISNRDYLDVAWQEQYGLNLPSHVLDVIAVYAQTDEISF